MLGLDYLDISKHQIIIDQTVLSWFDCDVLDPASLSCYCSLQLIHGDRCFGDTHSAVQE